MIPLFLNMSSGKTKRPKKKQNKTMVLLVMDDDQIDLIYFGYIYLYLFMDGCFSIDYFDEEPVGDTRACRDCQRSVFR